DANAAQDAEVYAVEGSVWRPAVRIPGGGFVAERLSRPSVAVLLLVTLAALVGLALVPSPPGREAADGVAPRQLVSAPEGDRSTRGAPCRGEERAAPWPPSSPRRRAHRAPSVGRRSCALRRAPACR